MSTATLVDKVTRIIYSDVSIGDGEVRINAPDLRIIDTDLDTGYDRLMAIYADNGTMQAWGIGPYREDRLKPDEISDHFGPVALGIVRALQSPKAGQRFRLMWRGHTLVIQYDEGHTAMHQANVVMLVLRAARASLLEKEAEDDNIRMRITADIEVVELLGMCVIDA